MKEKVYIYCIYFPTNNKYYVGQTKNLKQRMKAHLKSGSLVCKALYKYDDWQISILHTCKTRDEANRIEIEEIRNFNSVAPNGYNLTAGGDGNDSPRLEVTKEKMRQSHLGKKRPDISKCLKGRKLSEKHIENLKGNQNAKGKNLRNQFAKEANIGNQHAKGLKWSEESKGKMKGNQNALGYKHSKEAKKRMQISQLKRRIREMEQGGLL